MSSRSPVGFGDLLAERVARRESQIVLGIDPDPMALWPEGSSQSANSPPGQAGAAVLAHCRALINAASPACVAVKPQLACFERLGPSGWSVLAAVTEYAHERDLLVIADGKRGDIPVTAAAYAQGLMGSVQTPSGPSPGLQVNMATINPLMGAETIEPFLDVARAHGGGVLVLVRTSNPGAADIQDLELAEGGTLWERLATVVERLGRDHVGEHGLSDVGAVVGATVPAHLARARELMPNAVFLLPGVGAQGGDIQDLAPAFAPGAAGGLIAASRSIAGAHVQTGGDPASAARAEAERLRAAAWALV